MTPAAFSTASASGQGHLLSINAYHYARGGADVVYLNHAALMERHGWKNSFFSMHHAENIKSEDEAYFADEIAYDSKRSLKDSIVQAGKIIYSIEAQKKISNLLDSRKIDIAHVHSVYHHQSPSVLVELKKRGIPVVLTAHDLKLACPAYTMLSPEGVCERCKGGKVWNVALRRCIKGSLAASSVIMVESAVHKFFRLYANNVDRIVAPSSFYREKLIEWGWDADKIVHVRNFVDVKETASQVTVGDYVLFFGRLSREKGLATLIKAAARSKVPVKIAGRGPQGDELQALAESLSAPVEFLGFRSGQALWDVVDGAKAIVLPSEWYENGPMSVIEAFGRGKPLIGARIGGIPEMIVPGQTGWAFESGDVESLATALRTAWETPDARILDMAKACQALASVEYSDATYYNTIQGLYGDLLGRR
ncbi:MAG TPA: glycosyltransferase [Caulobacter sp.]|nr:glycosyltransferase [Caulobacter sp.]